MSLLNIYVNNFRIRTMRNNPIICLCVCQKCRCARAHIKFFRGSSSSRIYISYVSPSLIALYLGAVVCSLNAGAQVLQRAQLPPIKTRLSIAVSSYNIGKCLRSLLPCSRVVPMLHTVCTESDGVHRCVDSAELGARVGSDN